MDFDVPLPHIVLPLALSFVTFQQIAFLVDCYKNEEKISSNLHGNKRHALRFLDYCLFISFFPQLIAGPIVHHKEMMPQFDRMGKNNIEQSTSLLQQTTLKSMTFNWEFIAKGLFIFSIGLFKKACIADGFAKWANAGFEAVNDGVRLNFFEAWTTSLSYTFQLYFDFSGYCDMAIGLGLLFGIMLPINFNSPYKALNIADFWRRWHITLGRFLKEYLYIPLGGNRASSHILLNKILTLRNLFIVAFLSGIWHGAGWGFVVWGCLHGCAMVIHRIYCFVMEDRQSCCNLIKTIRDSKIYKIACWFLTFNFVNFAWVFFRAENISTACSILKSMFGVMWVELPDKWYHIGQTLEVVKGTERTMIYMIFACFICFYCKNSIDMMKNFHDKSYGLACFASVIAICSTISLLLVNNFPIFIYFNF